MKLKRITIVINQELEKKLRNKQGYLILKNKKTMSFSEVVRIYLEKGLKK